MDSEDEKKERQSNLTWILILSILLLLCVLYLLYLRINSSTNEKKSLSIEPPTFS